MSSQETKKEQFIPIATMDVFVSDLLKEALTEKEASKKLANSIIGQGKVIVTPDDIKFDRKTQIQIRKNLVEKLGVLSKEAIETITSDESLRTAMKSHIQSALDSGYEIKAGKKKNMKGGAYSISPARVKLKNPGGLKEHLLSTLEESIIKHLPQVIGANFDKSKLDEMERAGLYEFLEELVTTDKKLDKQKLDEVITKLRESEDIMVTVELMTDPFVYEDEITKGFKTEAAPSETKALNEQTARLKAGTEEDQAATVAEKLAREHGRPVYIEGEGKIVGSEFAWLEDGRDEAIKKYMLETQGESSPVEDLKLAIKEDLDTKIQVGLKNEDTYDAEEKEYIEIDIREATQALKETLPSSYSDKKIESLLGRIRREAAEEAIVGALIAESGLERLIDEDQNLNIANISKSAFENHLDKIRNSLGDEFKTIDTNTLVAKFNQTVLEMVGQAKVLRSERAEKESEMPDAKVTLKEADEYLQEQAEVWLQKFQEANPGRKFTDDELQGHYKKTCPIFPVGVKGFDPEGTLEFSSDGIQPVIYNGKEYSEVRSTLDDFNNKLPRDSLGEYHKKILATSEPGDDWKASLKGAIAARQAEAAGLKAEAEAARTEIAKIKAETAGLKAGTEEDQAATVAEKLAREHGRPVYIEGPSKEEDKIVGDEFAWLEDGRDEAIKKLAEATGLGIKSLGGLREILVEYGCVKYDEVTQKAKVNEAKIQELKEKFADVSGENFSYKGAVDKANSIAVKFAQNAWLKYAPKEGEQVWYIDTKGLDDTIEMMGRISTRMDNKSPTSKTIEFMSDQAKSMLAQAEGANAWFKAVGTTEKEKKAIKSETLFKALSDSGVMARDGSGLSIFHQEKIPAAAKTFLKTQIKEIKAQNQAAEAALKAGEPGVSNGPSQSSMKRKPSVYEGFGDDGDASDVNSVGNRTDSRGSSVSSRGADTETNSNRPTEAELAQLEKAFGVNPLADVAAAQPKMGSSKKNPKETEVDLTPRMNGVLAKAAQTGLGVKKFLSGNFLGGRSTLPGQSSPNRKNIIIKK